MLLVSNIIYCFWFCVQVQSKYEEMCLSKISLWYSHKLRHYKQPTVLKLWYIPKHITYVETRVFIAASAYFSLQMFHFQLNIKFLKLLTILRTEGVQSIYCCDTVNMYIRNCVIKSMVGLHENYTKNVLIQPLLVCKVHTRILRQ
jgi:hypothetical protein